MTSPDEAMHEAMHEDTDLTLDQITEILGRIPAAQAAAIIRTGARLNDVEEAAAWAAGESDVMAKAAARLTGAAAAVYDILTAEDAYADDRD